MQKLTEQYEWASKAFRLIQVIKDRTAIDRGLTLNDLCLIMYPDNVDKDGFPTHNAKTKIRSMVHQIRKINPDFLLFSRRYRTSDGRYEWRYFNMTHRDDLDDVIARLQKMVDGIEQTEKQIEVVYEKGTKRRKKELQEWEEEVINESKKDTDQ